MKYFLLVAFYCLFILCSCWEKIPYPAYYEFDSGTFNAQREQWQKVKPNNYEFTQRYGTYRPWDKIKITVVNGVKTSEENLVIPGRPSRIFADTIDDIYTQVEQDIAADKKRLDNKELVSLYVTIEYHKTWHYPEKISYTYSDSHETQPPGTAMGYDLTITDFKELP